MMAAARDEPGLTKPAPPYPAAMPDEVRIGVEPPPLPPVRSSRILALAAALVLLAGAGAWLAGALNGETTTTTGADITFVTTTTTAAVTTTRPLEERLDAARLFWAALGRGDDDAALAAFPAATPEAADLTRFVAAFRPEFTVGACEPFDSDAVQCVVGVTRADLLAIGFGTPEERVYVDEDGSFDVPVILSSAAARLSLYALGAYTEDLRTACPVTGNPQVPGLAIAGSATAQCGTYLAGLIPEYRRTQDGGPRE